MPKRDRTDKYSTGPAPAPKWWEGKTGIALAGLLTVAGAGGIAHLVQHRQEESAADQANPTHAMPPLEGLEKAIEEKANTQEKYWQAHAELVAAVRNYKTVRDERQHMAEAVLDIDSKSNPVYDSVAQMVNTVYDAKAYESPVTPLGKAAGISLEKQVEQQGSLFEKMFGFSMPTPDQTGAPGKPSLLPYAPAPDDNSYEKQIKVRQDRIRERVIPGLEKMISLKALQHDSIGPKLELMTMMDKHVHGIIDKISEVQVQVEKDRTRRHSSANADEIEQHNQFLEGLGLVKKQLNNVTQKLSRNTGQNIEIIGSRMKAAVEILGQEEERLRGDIAWFDNEKRDPQTPDTDPSTILSLLKVTEQELRIVVLIRGEVVRAQHLLDGRAPEQELIEKSQALAKDILEFTEAVRAIGESPKITELEQAALVRKLAAIEDASDVYKEEVKLAFPKLDKNGNYVAYKFDTAAHAPEPKREMPNFGDPEVRLHVVESLEPYVKNLGRWAKTWENTASGREMIKKEQANRNSPEYLADKLKSFIYTLEVELPFELEVARAGGIFDQAGKDYGKAAAGYEAAMKRALPDSEPLNRQSYDAKRRKARGETESQGPAQPEVHGFNYRPVPPAPKTSAAPESYGGVWQPGEPGHNNGARSPAPQFDYVYTGPTGDARETLEQIWPENTNMKYAPVREKTFHALRNTAGKEDPRITARRVMALREAFMDDGKGPGEMLQKMGSTAVGSHCQAAVSHWWGPEIIDKVGGQPNAHVGNVLTKMKKIGGFVPAGQELPQPGDGVFWTGHGAMVAESEMRGNQMYVALANANGNYGMTKIGKLRPWPQDFSSPKTHPGQILGTGKFATLAVSRIPELREPMAPFKAKEEIEMVEPAKEKPEKKQPEKTVPADKTPPSELNPNFVRDRGSPSAPPKGPELF